MVTADVNANEDTDNPSDPTVGTVLIQLGQAVRNVSLPTDLWGMYFLG